METKNLLKAIEIISKHHSNEIVINKVKPNGSANVKNLYIKNCVPSVITKLKDAGFSLSMKDGLLHVNDTFVQ